MPRYIVLHQVRTAASVAAISMMVGCHAGVGVKPSTMPTNTQSEKGTRGTLAEPEARAEGLAFAFNQVSSATEVIVNMTLANPTSDRTFWIDSKPSVGEGSAGPGPRSYEVEIAISDEHHRTVHWLCSEPLSKGKEISDFRSLRPGEKIEFKYRFYPYCYSLVPGEALTMGMSYMSRDNWPGAEEGTYLPNKPVWSGWQKIVVPPGWKDTTPPNK